jgi:hypothetical protein
MSDFSEKPTAPHEAHIGELVDVGGHHEQDSNSTWSDTARDYTVVVSVVPPIEGDAEHAGLQAASYSDAIEHPGTLSSTVRYQYLGPRMIDQETPDGVIKKIEADQFSLDIRYQRDRNKVEALVATFAARVVEIADTPPAERTYNYPVRRIR